MTNGGLSDYEKLRAQRIAEDRKFFEDVGLAEVKSELSRHARAVRAKRTTSRGLGNSRTVKRRKASKPKTQVVTRRSSGLKGNAADDVYVVNEGRGGKIEIGGQPSTMHELKKLRENSAEWDAKKKRMIQGFPTGL